MQDSQCHRSWWLSRNNECGHQTNVLTSGFAWCYRHFPLASLLIPRISELGNFLFYWIFTVSNVCPKVDISKLKVGDNRNNIICRHYGLSMQFTFTEARKVLDQNNTWTIKYSLQHLWEKWVYTYSFASYSSVEGQLNFVMKMLTEVYHHNWGPRTNVLGWVQVASMWELYE